MSLASECNPPIVASIQPSITSRTMNNADMADTEFMADLSTGTSAATVIDMLSNGQNSMFPHDVIESEQYKQYLLQEMDAIIDKGMSPSSSDTPTHTPEVNAEDTNMLQSLQSNLSSSINDINEKGRIPLCRVQVPVLCLDWGVHIRSLPICIWIGSGHGIRG